MPRKSIGAHLWHDKARDEFVIIDRKYKRRTGFAEADRESAERALAEYIGARHVVSVTPTPTIVDVLNTYLKEVAPHTSAPEIIAYRAESLEGWWGDKLVSGVTKDNCLSYVNHRKAINLQKAIERAKQREIKLAAKEKREPDLEDVEDEVRGTVNGEVGARGDLEVLRAAINYWHANKKALAALPTVTLPQKPDGRDAWMTRNEIAALLRQSRKATHNLEIDPDKKPIFVRHLARFILVGYYTGSRSGVVRGLRYEMVNFDTNFMFRKPRNTRRTKKQAPPLRLPRRLRFWLQHWKRIDGAKADYVVHYYREPVTTVKRSWATAREAAGLPEKVTPHTLRHSRATHLMRNKAVDDHDAAEFLGMTVQTFRDTYGHHDPEWQKEAADAR